MDFSSANIPISRDTWAPSSPPRQPPPPPAPPAAASLPYGGAPPPDAPPTAPYPAPLSATGAVGAYPPAPYGAPQPYAAHGQAVYGQPMQPAQPMPVQPYAQGPRAGGDRYETYQGASPSAPPRPPPKVNANNVVGVFGLSIRTTERDLEDEFGRFGEVEKVVIVYDQRTDRSRGFGFVTMRNIDGASRAVDKLNGTTLHGRTLRVDYSATKKAHAPTPGEYKGQPRPVTDDNRYEPRGGRSYDRDRGDRFEPRDRDRGDRYDRRDDRYSRDDRRDDRDRRGGDRYDRYDDRDRDYRRRDRDGDPYGGKSRRDRSPSPRRRYSRSPDRRRTYSPRREPVQYSNGHSNGAAPAPVSATYVHPNAQLQPQLQPQAQQVYDPAAAQMQAQAYAAGPGTAPLSASGGVPQQMVPPVGQAPAPVAGQVQAAPAPAPSQ